MWTGGGAGAGRRPSAVVKLRHYRQERAQITRCLVEGNSIRATVRMTGFAKNTIVKLFVELGAACAAYQDETLRALPCQRIQADEIWSFVYAKAKNVPEDKRDTFGYGDVWTWTAIDSESKLMISWLVGERSMEAARDFIADVASRVVLRPQVTTDANVSYKEAIEAAFGSDVDYAQLLKDYGVQESEDASPTARRYSPNVVKSTEKRVVTGNPTPTTSARHTSSAATSACGWACGASRADQRLLKESREPGRCRGALLHALQLRSAPSVARQEYDACDGRWHQRSRLDVRTDSGPTLLGC